MSWQYASILSCVTILGAIGWIGWIACYTQRPYRRNRRLPPPSPVCERVGQYEHIGLLRRQGG